MGKEIQDENKSFSNIITLSLINNHRVLKKAL